MIAKTVGCSRQHCDRVRQRFLSEGIGGLRQDAPRSGRPAKHDAQRIVTLTTTTRPEQETDWSRALMAQAAGVSASTVGRVWRRHGFKPHRVATLKVSNDPQFTEKLGAIIDSIWRRWSARWCCALTRRARSRGLIALNRGCPCAKAAIAPRPTITSVMARPRCSRL